MMCSCGILSTLPGPLEKGRAKGGEWIPRGGIKENVGQSFASRPLEKDPRQRRRIERPRVAQSDEAVSGLSVLSALSAIPYARFRYTEILPFGHTFLQGGTRLAVVPILGRKRFSRLFKHSCFMKDMVLNSF